MAHEPHNKAPDLRDASRGVRLQKLLASAGVGSRRACEELIEEGMVKVNGQRVEMLPVWVNPEVDDVTVRGVPLELSARSVYVMLYKPKNTVCTAHDPEGRRTVVDLVEHPNASRLYPVGRLDYDTLGLVLMTNDGEMAQALTHPRYGVHKTYRAIVKGVLTDEDVRKLQRGVVMSSRAHGKTQGATRMSASGIEIVHRDRQRTLVDITLAEGRNRQVRRMFSAVGCPVRKLTRVKMGPLKLKGLRVGEWRELSAAEIRSLKQAARKGKASADRASAGRSRDGRGGVLYKGVGNGGAGGGVGGRRSGGRVQPGTGRSDGKGRAGGRSG